MSSDYLRTRVGDLADSESVSHEDLAALYSDAVGDVLFASLAEGDIGLTGQAKIITGHPQFRGGSGVLLVKIRPRSEAIYRVLVCRHDDELGNVREDPKIVWRRFVGCGTTVFFESHAAHCARLNTTMRSRSRIAREAAETTVATVR
jgi:hypothetical protein